jgi:hypothetical protein
MMRQTPWKKIGVSRATWYRHGKPSEKPRKPKTVPEMAKQDGATSTRTYYCTTRALQSELGPLVMADQLSVAKADRTWRRSRSVASVSQAGRRTPVRATSGDNIRHDLILEPHNFIAQQQLSLFQPLHLLVRLAAVSQGLWRRVEVAVLLAQPLDLDGKRVRSFPAG